MDALHHHPSTSERHHPKASGPSPNLVKDRRVSEDNCLGRPSRIFETYRDPAATSSRMSQIEHPRSGWRALEEGILSIPIPAAPSPPISIPRANSKRKTRKSEGDTGTAATPAGARQELAAFGFFPREDKGPKVFRGFDRDWQDEEDLDMEDDEAAIHGEDGEQDVGVFATRQVEGLGRVPDPPFHPALRPAGIREFNRQQQQDDRSWPHQKQPGPSPVVKPSSDQPIFSSSQIPPLSSDVSSSLTSDSADIPRPNRRLSRGGIISERGTVRVVTLGVYRVDPCGWP